MLWLSHLERKAAPLASRAMFFLRLGRNFLATLAIVAFSLALGTFGYHHFGGVPWIDGFHNASMILTGMGPVDKMESDSGKLFASFYALYSGLVFLTMVVLVITPVYHRFLHRFHLGGDEGEATSAPPPPPADGEVARP